MKLSGYICAANVVKFDYCLELAARSLMPVVDELILCGRGSDDGTREMMEALAKEHPHVKIVEHPDPIPKGHWTWWTEWLNWTRLHCSHEMQITLDADEVLTDRIICHKSIYASLKKSPKQGARIFDRVNFWKDGHHLVPEGRCCSDRVVRLGPASLYMPSDKPDPKDPTIIRIAKFLPELVIFHLGFLRKPQAFWDKSRVVQSAYYGNYEPNIDVVEAKGLDIADYDERYKDSLRDFSGYISQPVIDWMKERGRL